MEEMKVVVAPKKKAIRHVTLRISEELMEKVDRIAKGKKISRQKLIAALLKQTLDDKSFVLKID